MRQTRLLILLVFVFSCKNEISKQNFRDTVIQNYFAMIDSSGMYDTAEMSYKALNAYVHDDTASLKKLDSSIKRL